MSLPILANAIAGRVVISCDAATARDLAEAMASAFATCDELEQERPRWCDDVVNLHAAAARADIQNGDVAYPVAVPLFNLTSVDQPGGEAGTTDEADRRAGSDIDPRPGSPAPLTLVTGGRP